MADQAGALLDVGDVAALLKKTKTAIRNMRARNQLPKAIKIRKCVRWKAADIEAWIAEQPRD